MPLPDYNFIPAPLWLITILHILTLTLHFAAMNFLVGGIIIVLWGKFGNRWEHPTVKTFVKLFPSAMAATVTLGVAPLLFVQLVYHRQMYSASIISGWYWLMIIAAVIFSYYFLYGAAFSKKAGAGRRGPYLLLALLGLVYVSIVYSSVFALAEDPDLMKTLYASSQGGLVVNPAVGDYVFRWLHMIFGAVTVGGFFIGLIGRDNQQAFSVGKSFYLWGLVAASVAGLAYLFTLGEDMLDLMRDPAIWVLTIAIVLALGALHFFFKKRFLWSGTMLFLSLLGMVYTRHALRLIRLSPEFDPSSIPVKPQWSIFIVFLVCFVLALGLLWYMLRLYFASKQSAA